MAFFSRYLELVRFTILHAPYVFSSEFKYSRNHVSMLCDDRVLPACLLIGIRCFFLNHFSIFVLWFCIYSPAMLFSTCCMRSWYFYPFDSLTHATTSNRNSAMELKGSPMRSQATCVYRACYKTKIMLIVLSNRFWLVLYTTEALSSCILYTFITQAVLCVCAYTVCNTRKREDKTALVSLQPMRVLAFIQCVCRNWNWSESSHTFSTSTIHC